MLLRTLALVVWHSHVIASIVIQVPERNFRGSLTGTLKGTLVGLDPLHKGTLKGTLVDPSKEPNQGALQDPPSKPQSHQNPKSPTEPL